MDSVATLPKNLLEALKNSSLSNVHVANEYTKRDRPSYHTNGNRFFTYVLQLSNNKIYVGDTSNIYARLISHFQMSESSAKWVRTHGPVVRILEITYDAPPGAERERFMEYASIFGFENVRGSCWCRDSMTSPFGLNEFKRGQMPHKFLNRSEIHQVERDIRAIVSELITSE